MKELNEKCVYSLEDLTSEQLKELAKYMQDNHGWKGQVPHTDLFWHDASETWLYNKLEKVNDMVNAKELFYTLENVQVDCRYLTNDQIDEIADVFEKAGYKVWDDDCALDVSDFNYLLEFTGSEVFVSVGSEEKITITYEKFMELFAEPQYEVTGSTQPHYDNTNGSIYKFCNDQKLNSWEFDIIKRVVRCRKKGLFKEDLQKTKDLIDLYLKEFTDEK